MKDVPKDPQSGAVRRGLRLLVIEDDPETLQLMLEMLELMGHWATGVKSAELAMARYLDGAFDIVLTDVGLPALSGLDLAQTLIERHGARIVFATGRSQPETLLPGTVWLPKPFGADRLQDAIDQALAL